ncbi:MAG: ATP-binding protein [Candidatus Thiodiazotropha weberae]|nr:ATP-binding protein [Candidatus Thiodiazotropha weberae]
MTEENIDGGNASDGPKKEDESKKPISIKTPPGKILCFIKQMLPGLSCVKTYRERFKRIAKKKNYAQNLKITTPSVMKICRYSGDSNLVATAFQSHTKINTGFMPYAGRKSKKVRAKKSGSISKEIKQLIKLENSFHNNESYHEAFSNLSINTRADGNFTQVDNRDKVNYLYDYLLRIPSNRDNNDNILIMGDIGCGKSTFVANFAHKLIDYNTMAVDQRPVNYSRKEPIFMDAEALLDKGSYGSTSKIYDSIISEITEKIKDQCEVDGDSLEEVVSSSKGQRVVLIFDNLDYVYHTFCYLLYGDKYLDEEIVISEYFPFLFKLISDFTLGQYCNLGISCIYVARNDTADLISYGMGQKDNGDRLIDHIDMLVEVNEVAANTVENIIKKRFALSDSMIANGRDALKSNIEKYNDQSSCIDILSHLSTHGLRHVISLYGELSWAIFTDEAFKRFFLDCTTPMLYLYLGGKTNYTQISEGITNIFLVNNEYRKLHNYTLSNGEKQYSDSLLGEHMHTYWLKYYILLFIYQGNATKSEVRQVFSKKENMPYAYEDGIVNLVLLSLSEFEHGRLIKPNIQARERGAVCSSGLECTNKGMYLIENNIFFSFWYLAVVIEDEWLEYPAFCFKDFSDYGSFEFLFNTNSDQYNRELVKMLITKIPLVLTFIDILEFSHKYEKDKCKDVFCTNLVDIGIDEPNFSSIRKSIESEISNYTKDFLDKDKEELRRKLEEYDSNRHSLRKSLNKFFKEVYYGGKFNREIKRKIAST